ncbi:MAG: hypothetical protein WCV88_04830 [Patescibacteria group bacterium]
MDPVNEFVLNLMKEAKLDTLPDDFKQSLQDQLMVQAYRRIGVVIMEELNDEQAGQFTELVANPDKIDQTAVNDFLTKNTTEKFADKIKTALTDLAVEFLKSQK